MRQILQVLKFHEGKIKCLISDSIFPSQYQLLDLVLITIWTLHSGLVSKTFSCDTKTILKGSKCGDIGAPFSPSVTRSFSGGPLFSVAAKNQTKHQNNNNKAYSVTGRKIKQQNQVSPSLVPPGNARAKDPQQDRARLPSQERKHTQELSEENATMEFYGASQSVGRD